MGRDDGTPDGQREKGRERVGISRRGFITSVGTGVIGAAVVRPGTAAAATEIREAGELLKVRLEVNGRPRQVLVEPRETLASVLRDGLGLTATKVGCGRGECGACTVLIDDRPRYSCLTLAVEAENHRVETLEGLMDAEELGAVQRAFAEEDGYQCGFCTPGQVMAAEGLLRADPHPSDMGVRLALSGNLCRCGAYKNIVRSVLRAAELRKV